MGKQQSGIDDNKDEMGQLTSTYRSLPPIHGGARLCAMAITPSPSLSHSIMMTHSPP